MTQFVSHIPVDVAVTSRPVRPHHIEIKDKHKQSDGNASFLRAARAGNIEKVLEYLKGSIDINTSNANGLNALHLASKEGHVSVVTELVKRGANVNAATKKGNTALHIASLAGQEEVVKILIRSGANVNVQSQNGFTPLYMAAQENHDNVVKFLLANSANQSLATEDGFTPLAVALQQGHDKVVAVLLENDAKGRVRLPALHIAAKKDDCKAAALLLQNDHDPDVTSKSGFTPLHIAAHYGNENIGKLLLEKSADVNYSAKHQITPLHVAAKWGKSNMVSLLVDKGAKIDASTRDGLTPLHCAARSGHDQVVDLLLEKGGPITAKTKNGLAPLHMASQGDHVDGARILLYHKAPVDDVTVDYLTALHVAAHCGHVRVAKLLLDRKADPNARALNGFTPLHIACKKNRIKVVELLLKHGASIEATTESGLTPLHVASFMGCMNIVIYLIQHGANPDVPTVRGETPLHLAARANQSDIIRILLRNGAHVDASAREQQTPLHIAARLGNVDIVGLLLQHGAAVDAPTKDMYTALHIAAKEGQEEVASVLLDHGASLTSTTKKGFTPLHLAAKYGNIKVARLLLQKDAPVDSQGKNGVTPLHVAAHYDHVNVALLLLDKGAYPHATAKNGYTPLHIAAKKNQMDIATTLLEYGAKSNAESKAGFTPLHLASQEGHTDMTTLLIEHHADVNAAAKNGLTPIHLCSQEDRVNVAAILVKNGSDIGPQTKAGYTPLHVACHFGQINMIRFLLQHGADVNATTSHGYTPLHQAAQQGHTLIINLLLEHKASPNTTTSQGQTALSIAQRLGYVSVVETLKIVTETVVTTTTTTVTEEKYKVVVPETMHETFMSDSEDEGAEDTMLGDQSFRYLTADEMKSLGDDSLPIDVTRDERGMDSMLSAPLTAEEDHLTPQHIVQQEATFSSTLAADNIDLTRAPIHAGKLKWKTFLVSFMVDARGGAMRGCRHSGVRVIIPPRKAPMPMRITCRYLRKEKLSHPPPLMEGEACASRILEVGPAGAKFLGPVIIEVPHFAALRGREREITILRSDNGEAWREHTLEASDDAVHDVFNESFEGEELTALDDLNTNRITRILTTDFPQYFALITRIRQEVHAIGPEGGMVSSTVVPQVQAIFPDGALTKKIKVGLQAQPITPELVTKMLGNRVAVSPIVTVEPRRRKFHKPITLTIPVPQAATKGMINQYSGDAPTLRLLCSITGGTTKAQWEDVTGSTPLTFVNDCVSFTTTVSARFWLMDCRQVNEATKFATELYREAIHVPFMAKFVVFAKRHDPLEAQLRVFCMTDDKEDKTLESQEHFSEVAKSRDVEVLESKYQYLEFAGNLVPVTKSGEQLSLTFQAFRENRLPFTIRVKDPHQEPLGRVAFMREQRVGRGEPPQTPICNLNIALPEAQLTPVSELVTLEKKYGFVEETGLANPELIHRADLRLSDIAKELRADWVPLALQLDVPETDINSIRSECPDNVNQQALIMLRHWLQRAGSKATGNSLEKALRKINREDIVNQCMFNVELVTDDVEKAVAKVHLDQSGFDTFKEELGSSRDTSLRRDASLNGTLDERDIMKEAESAAETSSEGSDKEGHLKHEAESFQLTAEPQRGEPEVKEVVVIREIVNKSEATLVELSPAKSKSEGHSDANSHDLSNGLPESSIQEDEKSDPTTAVSSEATAEFEISSTDEKPDGDTHTERKEWTETDESGGVKQVTQIKTETSIKVIGGKEIPCNDEELLSFVEKRNFFQRLSLTSDNVPTTAKWMQDVSLDDIPMAQGEIVNEEISFEDRLKMFEHDEENFRRKIQKNGKQDQPTVYRYDFTKSGKEKLPTPSDLEKAEAIVQKVNDELVNDGDLISSVKHPAANESCSLEAAEQEVSTLLAEVDREEQCDDVEDIIESIISSENLDTGVSAVEIDDSEDFGLDERRMSDGAFIESPVSDQDGENIADLGYHEESNLEFEDSLSIREYSTSRLDSLEQSEAVVEEVAEKVIERTCQPEERIHEDNLHEDSSLVEMGISQRVVTVSPFTLEELHEEGTGCRDYRRESFREALELEAEEKLLNTDPDKGKIQKELPNKNLDISAVVKSQILDEELGQCIEDSPLEVKHISEEFEKATVLSTQSEDKVYKHIKTEIFSQELGEDIESGSPEHKDISPVNPSVDVVELFVTESSTTGDADENVSKGDVSSEAVKPEDENITEITDISDLQPLSPTENIEHDDLEEYEEAKDEHSLSEQLLALASNVSQPVKCIADEDFLDGESSSGDPIHAIFDPSISHRSSACRKGKETGFSRIDKKEIRSFKATKQVSTIEEHSSIESSDSPQELFSHDFSESQLNSYGVKLSENLKVSEAVDDSFVPDEIQNDFKQDVVTEVSLTSDIASTFDVTVESKTDLPHVFVSDDHKSDIESPEDEYPKKSDIESPEDDEYPKKSDIQSSEDHEPHSKKSDVESPIDLEHPSTKSDFELPKSHESKSDIESPEGHETKSDIESPEGHETMKLDTESPEDHDSSFKRSDIESPEDHELLFKKPDNQQTFGKPPSPPSDSKSSKDSKKSDSDNEGSKLPCAELLAPAKKDESFSSSGEMESHYYSAETSDSGKTPRSTPVGSRPCSSEFEVNVLSGQGSEYETCVTSQDGTGELSGSYSTAATSQETSYSTACSSFSHSSRESAYSVDSESSGHLASVEISSEASETLVPSAQEMELEFATELEMPVLDEEASSTALLLKEPYDMEIPESVIRSGVELPFFKNWDLQTRNQSEPRGETSQWPWHCPEQSESFTDYENTKPDDHGDTTPLIEGNAGSFEAFSSSSADRPTESACASQSSSFIQHAFTENSERKDANNKYNEKPCSGKAHSAFSSETQSLKHAYGISLETDDAVDPGGACVEEELSVSESSVTQSEQTWQTNSLDTAIQLSSHVPVSHVILDTQVATSFTDSLSDIPPEVTASLEHVSVSSEQHMPYLQLNGPIEVDYNPEYDAFEGDDSALPENPPQLGFQLDELQFELEEENDVPENHHAVANGIAEVEIEPEHDESHEDEDDHFNVDAENGEGSQFDGMPGSAAPNGVPVCVGRLTEAEKPEAQQQQAVGEFEDSLRSENVVFQDQTSYLPESDQENIRSLASENFEQEPSMSGQAMLQGVGDPDVDDAVEDAVEGAVEENISFEPKACSSESMDKAEVVDTFPEDERYDCLFQKPDATDVKASPSSDISETNDLLESDAGVYLDPPSDLYTHHEEDDMELKESDMFPSPIPEESKQSTPSFDALPGRKFFPRSGDTSAASSLQEFERLEADIAAGRCSQTSADSLEKATSGKSIESDDLARRMLLRSGETSAASSLLEFERLEADIAAGRISRASIDSCEKIISGKSLESDYLARRIIHRSEENSTASSLQEFERLEAEFAAGRVSRSSAESFEKPPTGKSSERDDISMSSLADFEKLEKEISEQEQTVKASAGEPVLSEVDEGLESQISDIQGLNADPEHADSDDSEYEKRMTEIEEAIQLAQTNVEKFHEETVEDLSEGMTYEEYTVTHTSDSSQKYTTDTDVETVANAQEFAAKSRKGEKSSDETEIHTDSSGADNGLGGQDDSSNSSKNGKGDCMISSTDSVDPSSSTATHATYQFETDSVMSSSINSTQASGEECTMVSSTDTLESETKITYSQGELGSEGDNANVAGGIVSESNFVQVSSYSCDIAEGLDKPQKMEMFLTNLTHKPIVPDDQTSSELVSSSLHSSSSPPTYADHLHKIGNTPAASAFDSGKDAPSTEISGLCQQDEDEGGDDVVSHTTTTTTRIVTTVTTDDGVVQEEQVTEGGDELRRSMEEVLNQFMTEDKTQDSEKH